MKQLSQKYPRPESPTLAGRILSRQDGHFFGTYIGTRTRATGIVRMRTLVISDPPFNIHSRRETAAQSLPSRSAQVLGRDSHHYLCAIGYYVVPQAQSRPFLAGIARAARPRKVPFALLRGCSLRLRRDGIRFSRCAHVCAKRPHNPSPILCARIEPTFTPGIRSAYPCQSTSAT